MQILRKNKLLIITSFIILTPLVVGVQVFTNNMPITMIKSLNKDNLETIPTVNERDDDIKSIYERDSSIYLNSVLERLSSGEEPSTSESVFLSYSDRLPDLPDWVEIQRYFKLVPLIQISTNLENIPNLPEIRHVDAVIPVGKGVLAKISSFTQDYNPYVGEFPLLLNETISSVEAENDNKTGSGVIIAILSTGIDETHPMLDDQDDDWSTTDDFKVIDSYDAWDGGITDDQNGRGTALASVVAGTGAAGGRLETELPFTYPYPLETDPEYETQIVNTTINTGTQMGLAPEASLFDIKITNNAGDAYNEGVAITGIEWAVDHGADIILLDELPSATSAIISVIEAATSRGVLVIVPAGDFVPSGGYDDDYIAPYYTINSPASAPTALTVGATTETDSLWVQSKRGPVPDTEHSKPDVVAPGVFMLGANIDYSTSEGSNPGGWQGDAGDTDDTLYYDVFSSTAMAAAVTAGVSARLIEAYPGASPTAIKIALRKGATDLGFNEMAQGKGKISLSEALDILEAAPKEADNFVGHIYKEEFTVPIVSYTDFSGKRILIDGSWSTSTISFPGGGPYDWSQQTNGNLSTLGVTSNWQHPYDDTVDQYTWYNVSYQGASQVRITLDNLTLATGDNFTIYRSSTPNGPLTTVYGPATSNSSTPSISTTTDNYFYFRWGSDGDGYTTGQSVFGIYGSVDLWFYADTTRPPAGTFEFDSLATQLTNLGAVVEYWYANSADAPPTSILLEYYDIYFLGQPLAVTTTGIPVEYYQWMSGNLTNYLNAGGRVLFIGDQENQYYNNATESLGVTWHYGGGGGPTTDIVTHVLTTYPFAIEELLIDAPYAYFTGTATTLVQEAGKATIKYYDQNNGKAVFITDEDVFNDDLWDDPFPTNPNPGRYNNSQLAMNIFYWMFDDVSYQSGERNDGGEEHFELISYEYKSIMTDEDLWDVEIVLQNVGNFTSQAWVAFGFDYTPTSYTLGFGAIGNPDGVMDTAGEDNLNDTGDYIPGGDGDINSLQSNTIIEFYYNISENYPVDQVAMPYIEIYASGMDRDTAECLLSLNGIQIGPIYETNTSTGGTGIMYYPINPTSRLRQYNNTVEISVPDSIDLTLESFRIVGYNFSNSLGTQHTVTSSIAPNQNTVITFQYTPPDLEGPAYYEPEIIFTPYNMTHAQISPGYASSLFKELDLTIDYGLIEPGHYTESGTQVYAIPKTARQGDLPLLYDISPGSLSPSSSTKIVQFPGDIRVDGLTVMSSKIVEKPSLQLSGGITSVAGLGNYSESSVGIGAYIALAPEWFIINDTWTATNQLNMVYLNHSSIGPILQIDIPPDQSPTTFSGSLALISNGTSLYQISLQLIISDPISSLMLLDTLDLYKPDYLDLDYDKLWDQLFEMWQIAAAAGYDIDSLSQTWYLYGHRTHDDSVSADAFAFLEKHVCDIPLEEDLPYEGLIGSDLADTFNPGYLSDFFERGGNLIQLGIGGPTPGTGDHLGPNFAADIDYHDKEEEMTTLVSGSDSTNPLMDAVDQLFYLGGGYMIVDQESYDEQLTYDVITGQNWLDPGTIVAPNPTRDITVIYHDAIYPDRFGYDQGQYTNLAQTYKGLKIVLGSTSMTQSWFLEQTDYWAYGSMKNAAEQNIITEAFNVDLDNKKFVENIIRVGGNMAPTIESINMTTRHVGPGDYVTVHVQVSDDLENPSDLTVLCPEKVIPGMTYINCSYDSNSSAFIGSFPIVDTTLIDNWNIYVIDDLFRITEAVDGVKNFLIPEMNVKPVAWIPFNDEMNYYSVIDVEQGELLSIAFYYDDFEDGDAIICNVSLVYYFNEEETEIVSSELFAGLGQGIFLVDTTNLRSGTHIVFAYVTDTDGGTAEYQLAGFNIGKGTLYKPKPRAAGIDPVPIIVVGGSTLGIAAAVGGGWYFLLHKRGMGIRDLFRRD